MFDSVGGPSFDHDDSARQAQATLLVSLLTTVLIGAMLGAGAWTLRQAPLLPLDPEVFEPIALHLAEPWQPDSAPAAPRGQAARPSSEPAGALATSAEPTSDPPPEPSPTERPATTEPSTDGGPGGDDDGVAAASTGGCLGPRCTDGPGTSGDGDGDGGGAGARPTVHYSELEVRRRVLPVWPAAARGLGLGEQLCTAQLVIDATGLPTAVEVHGCPALYHPNVKRALLEWRWYPPRVLGARREVQTTLLVRFRER